MKKIEYRLNAPFYVWSYDGKNLVTHIEPYGSIFNEKRNYRSRNDIDFFKTLHIIPESQYHKYPIIVNDLKEQFYKDLLET